MKYDHTFFDQGLERRGTHCVKWDACCSDDDLPMWVADWDFPCADPISEAIRKRAEHPCYGYPTHTAEDDEAFCSFWQRRHHLDVKPEQLMMLPTVIAGMRLAVRCFSDEQSGAVIMPPLYGPFRMSILLNHRALCAAPLTRDESGRYSIDYEAVENQLKNGCRLVLFCNPHNPVSRAWSRDELQQLLDLCIRYKAILVSDEIHADFVYAPNFFTPMLSLQGADDCVVTLTAPTKAFNLPGLQQAMVICRNPDLLQKMRDEADAAGIASGNIFARAAAIAAYTQCDDWLDGMLTYLDESRCIVREQVTEKLPNVILSPIEATALCWLDFRSYGKTSKELYEAFKNHGIILNEGTSFGPV